MPVPSLPFLSRPPPATVFVPGDRFFVRVIPIAPDLPPEEQVELALEGLAPFPLPQLWWGFLLSADRASALIYAAHRRRFTNEETKSWSGAGLVIPSFLPAAVAPGNFPAVVVHAEGNTLAGAAWVAAPDQLPRAFLVRGFAAEPTPEEKNAFARDLATRAGIQGSQPLFLKGTPELVALKDGLAVRIAGSNLRPLPLTRAQLDQLDIRDREFLATRREQERRGALFWNTLLAGVGLAVLACIIELAALGMKLRTRAAQATIEAQKPAVERLETAHTLATRVDELSRQRLLPFEMLVVLNDKRPASVQFVHTTTQGSSTLQVEAQTANAGDVTIFEQALHDSPDIVSVKTSDIRARDGLTSFVMQVIFKPESLRGSNKNPA